MLANQLGRRGVRTRIIDRHSGPAQQTRALGVQARTLEIYAKLGIVDRALELGKRGNGANLWANGRKMARVPLGDAGRSLTRYPYILVLGQDDNERIMGARLADWGLAVEWNTELVALEQDESGVTAHAEAAGRHDAQGHGRVGRRMRRGEERGARAHRHRVSGRALRARVLRRRHRGRRGPWSRTRSTSTCGARASTCSSRCAARITGGSSASCRRSCAIGTTSTFDDVVPSMRAEAGAALAFRKCTWFSTYRIAHRGAERFRRGRCFLLGDAAHIHSPVGAQGMNTGLQDAYNLAWKLALVVAGRAEPGAGRFVRRRAPAGRAAAPRHDRPAHFASSSRTIRSPASCAREVIARIAAFAMRREAIQRFAFRTVSQTGIHYRQSPLSESAAPQPRHAPQAGDRFPWLQLEAARRADRSRICSRSSTTRGSTCS